MLRHHHQTKLVASQIVALVALLGACAEEEELAGICVYLVDPSECNHDTGGEETGSEPEPEPCTLTPDGHTRTVYQCAGEFSVSLSFNTLLGDCAKSLGDPLWCVEDHEFGPQEESYEMSAVVACCDAQEELVDTNTVVNYCRADLIEQVCRSLPTRLQAFIDAGAFPVGENQAQKLQNWLAENQQDCYEQLFHPTDEPGILAPVSWLVNDGNNQDWSLLHDFTITLDFGHVDSASVPEDPGDYLSCEGNNVNNTEVFEGPVPLSSGINQILYMSESASASLVGPEVLGGRVSGTGRFQSQASACVGPWCSMLEVTTDESAGQWTLEELELFANGQVELTNGKMALMIDRSAVRLYQVALGTIQTDRRGNSVYAIQAGEAHFVISGVGGGTVPDVRWASNSSPITARRSGGSWLVDSFVIEHVDRDGNSWTITVPSTLWK